MYNKTLTFFFFFNFESSRLVNFKKYRIGQRPIDIKLKI